MAERAEDGRGEEPEARAARTRFDLSQIIRDFKGAPPNRWRWLSASYEEPERFLQALLDQHAKAHRLPHRSKIGERYDLFHDCLKRHAEGSSEAMRVHGARRWQSLSYAALWRRVCQRATFFERRGLAPGVLLCLLRSQGFGWLTDLFAAFKVGAVVSLIEPISRAYARRRLAALAPDVLVADVHYEGWLEGDEALDGIPRFAPEGMAKDAVLVSSGHAYGRGEEAMRAFSPFSRDPLAPVSVPAEMLYQGALRDALLVYGLRPGEAFAAPGFAVDQHQPALTLATCFAGASNLLASETALASDPDVGKAMKLSAVGLSRRWRQRLPRDWMKDRKGRWFASLSEPLDIAAIQNESKALSEAGMEGCFVCHSGAFGGSFLILPQPSKAGMPEVAPMPGQRWSMGDPGGTEMPAEEAGVFLSEGATEQMVGNFLIGSAQRSWYFAGALGWTRGGRLLPAEEIAAAAETDPRVVFASLVLGPTRFSNSCRAVLLAFAAEGADQADFGGEIMERVKAALGARHAPDQVEIYPLFPRLAEGRPDAGWCQYQYFGGMLNKKRRDPLFAQLGEIQRLIHRLRLAAAERRDGG